MPLGKVRLLGLKSLDDAAALFGELGYTAALRPLDLAEVPLPGLARALYRRSAGTQRKGYGLIIGEAPELARSLRPLASALQLRLHDRPLGVVGIPGHGGRWERMVILRPRRVGARTVLAKLDVDLLHPTQHDARVIEELAWRGDTSQEAIDRALDVTEVTRQFFVGLAEHYQKLQEAVRLAVSNDLPIRERLKALGGDPEERLALRILVQVLFCEFLQRKGFIEGRSDWLTWAWSQRQGPYYATVLEPLFYDALGTPVAERRREVPGTPYLNGGLFERPYGPLSLDLPDDLFSTDGGLLGYLDGWSFTLTEDMPEEAEVAVDPEMLGKVFEHLAGSESIKEHGTVYTPRPVVHFMCREALVPWLEQTVGVSEATARHLLTDPEPVTELIASLGPDEVSRLLRALPEALDELRILDPAVGSGAFPLGMLIELVRLRRLCHVGLEGSEPLAGMVHGWKLRTIERTLMGVDIEPRAIELYRLRLWLSLVVDLPAGENPSPLPNLEFRSICANSLTDFVHGVNVWRPPGSGTFPFEPPPGLADLHERWFEAAQPHEKALLRQRIGAIEQEVVHSQLRQRRDRGRKEDEGWLAELEARFAGPDRQFPCFVPPLHAPEVEDGAWDVVIMNPPYVGRKEVPRRLASWQVGDLELQYGGTNDLMILFARRALELVRPGGVVSMIFNDSIFSSTDAEDLRRRFTDKAELRVLARTRCFEGKAITGGVVVMRSAEEAHPIRWVEGHHRPVADFAEASNEFSSLTPGGLLPQKAGELEVWAVDIADYRRLPNRPLFRPSPEARGLIPHFERTDGWSQRWGTKDGWALLSQTRSLDKELEALRVAGRFDRLSEGDWVLLGTVIQGGQGLATADDKRFLAAIEGTKEAAAFLRAQKRLEALVLASSDQAAYYRSVFDGGREEALLACWDHFGEELRWPKGATFRVVSHDRVHPGGLSAIQRQNGLPGQVCFVPFEKGDDSDEVAGRAIGAAWWRENPLVIDWSSEAVALLHARARAKGSQSPRIQNEDLWGMAGVTWNNVASYLRPRLVPEGSIFGHKAPTIRPTIEWLSPEALCALLFSDTVDFLVRTLLGSRMMIEVGDIRRVPIPVLGPEFAALLDGLGKNAVMAKQQGDAQALGAIEVEVHKVVRCLYGLSPDAELWVVR